MTTAKRVNVGRANAERVARDLHAVLKVSQYSGEQQYHEFTRILREVYLHTMGETEGDGPLGLDWSLQDGAVCKALYEQLTGMTCE